MTPLSLLLLDDDPGFHLLVTKLLSAYQKKRETKLHIAEDLVEARKLLKAQSFQIIFLDLSLKGKRDAGFSFLEEVRKQGVQAEIIVMSSSGTFESVQRAMRLGANDYIAKGFSPAEFTYYLEKAIERGRWRGMEKRLQREWNKDSERFRLVGNSPRMQSLRESLRKLAPTNVPVLVEAETGTGKELVARNLHLLGRDPSSSFVAVDCGAIPHSMAESILFGHEKGAFTGADAQHIGVFEAANGGTLFLDEIGSLSLDLQNKLLRALQEKEIRRVGSQRVVQVDFRLIAAANKNLEREVELGRFKQDLLFRINVIQVSLPPLRERVEDIEELVSLFAPEKKLSPELLSFFQHYRWPGNIRELKNLVQAATILSGEEKILGLEHLPERVFLRLESQGDTLKAGSTSSWKNYIVSAVENAEKQALAAAYQAAGKNVSRLAAMLELNRAHLHQKLVRFGIHKVRA